MKPHSWSLFTLLLLSSILLVSAIAQAQDTPATTSHTVDLRAIQPANRITAVIDDRIRVVRSGNRHPLARAEYDLGVASPQHRLDRMMLVLQPDGTQQKALDDLLAAQQDPESPQYHQWLTPETFGSLFGVSAHDIDQVVNWLSSHGFDIEPIPDGRRVILFSGTASQVESAFRTAIHRYNVNGEQHYANATDPQIPRALAGVVGGIVSLHDFHAKPMHTAIEPLSISSPDFTSGAAHYMSPVDFATIYDVASLYNSALDGTGQSIAIAGRSNFQMSDVQSFRSTVGLPANNPTVILNGANPGIVSSNEQFEATLDVEWSGAVAKNASIQFVLSASTNSSDGIALSSQYIVNHNVAPVMSLSFGNCEAAMGTSANQFWNSLWQQAASQGITVLVSSGDSGAAGCDSASAAKASGGAGVNGLCSPPYSTCVGGTQFNDVATPSLYWSASNDSKTLASALSYIPEAIWNESANVSGGSGLWSGGGGASQVYPKPSWQTGAGVPADGHRDVPDVSLSAAIHDGYLVTVTGKLYVAGGTSASAPSFAGLMGLVGQKTGARQGNVNPALYILAGKQSTGGAAVFHDVVTGNNSVPGQTGITAGPGYDLASGLGSVDAWTMVNHWSDTSVPTPNLQVTASTNSLSWVVGTKASVTTQVAVSGGFSSAVTLSASPLPSGLTAGFSPSTFAAPGSGSSTLTLNAGATMTPGAYNLNVTATGGGLTRSVPLAVTVLAKCTYSLNATSVAPPASGGSFSSTISTVSGCPWTASSGANWITFSGATSGSGNGSVNYTVQANSATSSRSSSLTIAGVTVTVTQAGAPAATLSPTSASYSTSGGKGSFTVTTPGNASWTATSNSTWIAITSGGSSAGGNKTVNYSVAANTGATARTGTITVSGVAFTITESGLTCTYSVSVGAITGVSGGFNGSISVFSPAGCSWTASSNVSWLSVTSGSSGAGNGTVLFFAASNPNNSSRTGVLTVAGFNIALTEGAHAAIKHSVIPLTEP